MKKKAAQKAPKPYSLADLKKDLKKRGLTLGQPKKATRDQAKKALALLGRAGALDGTGSRARMDGGYVELGVNEVSVISLIQDPIKVRGAVEDHTIYCIVSGNRLKGGVQREKVMIMLREDDEHLGQDGGMIEGWCQIPGTEGDKGMIRVWQSTTRKTEFFTDVVAPNFGGGSGDGNAGFKMTSADGRYELILQNHDAQGLLVYYDKVAGKSKVIATPPR